MLVHYLHDSSCRPGDEVLDGLCARIILGHDHRVLRVKVKLDLEESPEISVGEVVSKSHAAARGDTQILTLMLGERLRRRIVDFCFVHARDKARSGMIHSDRTTIVEISARERERITKLVR